MLLLLLPTFWLMLQIDSISPVFLSLILAYDGSELMIALGVLLMVSLLNPKSSLGRKG
jgi:hypothetical protein